MLKSLLLVFRIGKLKGLFGGSGSGSASTSESTDSDSKTEADSDSNSDSGVANTTETTAAEGNVTHGDVPVNEKSGKSGVQNQKTSDTIRLEVEVKPLSMPAMTQTEIRLSRTK